MALPTRHRLPSSLQRALRSLIVLLAGIDAGLLVFSIGGRTVLAAPTPGEDASTGYAILWTGCLLLSVIVAVLAARTARRWLALATRMERRRPGRGRHATE